ncbi:retrovirus-related pol polyprotein from transposon TNT 1-94, partial [Tanacetum coccineum]
MSRRFVCGITSPRSEISKSAPHQVASESDDEEYAMAVRDFKKFFRRRGKFVRQPHDDKKNFRKIKEDKRRKKIAFVVGCWSDSEEDSKKEEICLMALDNNEVLSDTPYYSSSSLNNESLQNEYDKLCKISLRLINKNRHLKTKNELLKNEACDLRKRVEQLERNKETCESCVNLESKVSSLSLKLASFENSSIFLQEMLEKQKTQKDKHGIGFTEDIAFTSNTETKTLSPVEKNSSTIESASPVPSAREPASSIEQNQLSAEKSENLETNVLKRNSSVQITRKPSSNTPVRLKVKLEPDEWIKDSGCSRHMTGNKDLFSTYKAIDGDHGREFDNEVQFRAFCDANGITHNFLAPHTPQSNGVVERKNPTLQEMSRTMLNEQSIPQKFWCNVVDTSTYIFNRNLEFDLSPEKKDSLRAFQKGSIYSHERKEPEGEERPVRRVSLNLLEILEGCACGWIDLPCVLIRLCEKWEGGKKHTLDEGYSSENYVRKFFRALHPKWRAKVTAIEELKDLTSLSLDELIGNLKVHDTIIKKDSKIVKAKVERKSLALKAKKEYSDEECSTSSSEDEKYAMTVREFKKFFKRRDPNHLIGECPKPPRDKNQRAFVGGSWSDSVEEDDEKVQDETCLVAQAPNEVCFESSYFSDENSSIDDLALDNEYDKMCKISLKIITKNKRFGFNSFEASSTGTKEINFVNAQKKTSSDEGPIIMGGPFNVQICLGINLEPDKWIKDSGCSKHMTGYRKLFSTYKAYNGGNVIFGSNHRGNIIGKGTISNDSLKIDNVEHVDNLGFNFLSIGQICDNKCRVTFFEHDSEITQDGKVIGRGIRKKGLYVMKLRNKPKDKICLATIDENSTLWHRRLGHANMHLIQLLASKELVRNLPKLRFDQHFCDACKIGKQAHVSHKAKNIVSTTRCLELLHMDLFGPSTVRSYEGNRYTLVIVDNYS